MTVNARSGERLQPALSFNSRRSNVLGTKHMVATSQPLASSIGLHLLDRGCNALEAAIGVAAALNVTEPCSNGIGGDMFCLFYSAAEQKVFQCLRPRLPAELTVFGINGSGRSPRALSTAHLRDQGIVGDSLPPTSIHCVTVPGAVAGWCDALEAFGSGKYSMSELLEPAASLAEGGFPVSELAARQWKDSETLLLARPNGHEVLLKDGDTHRAPRSGEIMHNPTLAATLRLIGQQGKQGFYDGRIASEIAAVVQQQGGLLAVQDLKGHLSETIDPISVDYEGTRLWECPPNGQGRYLLFVNMRLTALMALGILEAAEEQGHTPLTSLDPLSADYTHMLIEALRIAFADTRYHVSDPAHMPTRVEHLLAKPYLRSRARLIDAKKASFPAYGSPANASGTVYFAVADKQGNACSFIQSNYMGFGNGSVPKGCGFTLQNRGANFVLSDDVDAHPNCLRGGKRPYHTIIPGMVTRPVPGDPTKQELVMAFGVMGGPDDNTVFLEEGYSEDVIQELRARGHSIQVLTDWSRSLFGRGQIIAKTQCGQRTVWTAGSDGRADGCAMGY
ncbi:hypothetical protein RI367_000837 [Sorochytrium milnesiophthora]